MAFVLTFFLLRFSSTTPFIFHVRRNSQNIAQHSVSPAALSKSWRNPIVHPEFTWKHIHTLPLFFTKHTFQSSIIFFCNQLSTIRVRLLLLPCFSSSTCCMPFWPADDIQQNKSSSHTFVNMEEMAGWLAGIECEFLANNFKL